MECYDYPYYSTLDVRFYGSMPLVKFWPDLDKTEMRTFAETVLRSEPEKLMWNWKTDTRITKSRFESARAREPCLMIWVRRKKIRSSRSTSSAGRIPTTGKI